MTEQTPEGTPEHTPAEAATSDRGRGLLLDVAIVLGWFLAAGILGALLWWRITPLPAYTRTSDNAVMPATEFGKQVATDGWYFLIAAVFGVLSGIVLSVWRHRDPVATVLLVLVGAGLAAWVMLRLGLTLGPADPRGVIHDLPVGGKAPLRLQPQAHGVWTVWPIAALLGSLAVLLGTTARTPPAE